MKIWNSIFEIFSAIKIDNQKKINLKNLLKNILEKYYREVQYTIKLYAG